MKTNLTLLIAGALLLPSTSVYAPPDQIQIIQHERAVAAKRKAAQEELVAQRAKEAASVAGPKGEEGKLGPTETKPPAANRWNLFRFHP